MLSLLATTLAASPLVPNAAGKTNPVATFTVSGGVTGTFKAELMQTAKDIGTPLSSYCT